MTIIPYLAFNGNCEAALNYYKEVFGGEVAYFMRFKEAPDMTFDEEGGNRVMHAQLNINGVILYMSDTFPSQPVSDGSRVKLTIEMITKDEQTRIFNALAVDGNIDMALEDTFWGARYGAVTDQFGISWGLNCEK